jgi:hypothetical protein
MDTSVLAIPPLKKHSSHRTSVARSELLDTRLGRFPVWNPSFLFGEVPVELCLHIIKAVVNPGSELGN